MKIESNEYHKNVIPIQHWREQKNLGPKPITSSMKQVMQRDGRKIWKDVTF
jgi:hypothetical protein